VAVDVWINALSSCPPLHRSARLGPSSSVPDIQLNLKNQIMTTNLWVEQSWDDYKLKWDPREYGGVEMLHVPSDHIWRPDIVLYNNADGNFEVTLATKATLNYTGRVEWKPPAIYKSSCEIDVEYFPFDEQTCVMKFGSWTYDGFQVDLRHIDEVRGSSVVDIGVDLSEFYTSVEWDILEVPAVRNEKFYTCCDEPYLDITFNITMRRKTLFYTVNLIIPCMGISFLTVLVFYLPSDSGEKVSLSISILLSLTVFFLLLAEIIPPTSLVVPLLGKFTHTMAPWVRRVFIHVLPRLLVMRRPHYNPDRRRWEGGLPASASASSAGMGPRVMVRTCNGLEMRDSAERETSASDLVDSYPQGYSQGYSHDDEFRELGVSGTLTGSTCRIHGTPPPPLLLGDLAGLAGMAGLDSPGVGPPLDPLLPASPLNASPPPRPSSRPPPEMPHLRASSSRHWHHCPELHKAMDGVCFIADHTKREEDSTRVKEDWKYVAMVLDRLFLWIFTLAVLVGTAGIILQAPTLYDDRMPIDVRLSEIAQTTAKPHIASGL
ncbi:hypothetical protein FOCC_FOCC004377, partial [Frankliniella occidentalis]